MIIIIIYSVVVSYLFTEIIMAAVLNNSYKINNSLHSLLLEKDLLVSQSEMEHFISIAHQQCLDRLQHAALREGLIDKEITSLHIHDYLDLLYHQQKKQKPEKTFDRWPLLKKELDESINNQALALAYYHCWQQSLKQQAKNHSSLWSWLSEQHNKQQILTFLEQWGCIGHPYHPNFRAKMGFIPEEVIRYSPEFNAQVDIPWLAIHRSVAFTSIDATSYSLLFAQHFAKEYQLWNYSVQKQQLDPDQYLPLPVHPWQWNNKLQTLASVLINSKQLLITEAVQKTKPSMSFRTMMPLDNKGPHLKLATAIHTTSALRTVSPASVSNSSPLSSWLRQLLTQYQSFEKPLFLARDLAGINTTHPSISPQNKKHLAMIVRENPLELIDASQTLVPVAALYAISPVSQRALFVEIIEASGMEPELYFIEYSRCILECQLHLLLSYGVALEAQQQNTLVIFQSHRPVGLVIRDLGGIRVCFNSLYETTPKPNLHPDSTISCHELSDLFNTFIYGNLLSNLTFCINCLHDNYNLTKKNLWILLKQIANQLLQNFKKEINPLIYQKFQQHLLSLPWQHKSLLSMRLNQNQDSLVFFSLDNPLSQDNE
ncbi:siderophore legiobactin biosynthesis protein LbtA [Legionella pneumophila]|nr:siderophore legiobactin biosynthesis protein LbtA [Legionella pneumophila]HAT9854489.1 siderophore legiobactin biosynthesis protein LbtA [Legionella pneumophila subsp. pneumophila]HAT8673661.1 siderophore legiobactin biosynthesis protein LbtA [Legionella pneumophila]HAU1020075.1 siderophore legiobactin biosynthesis protein LbtA [Legionella pneumophila]HAU1057111.1 siderophore legiobactin biosynthesis protein LbtA [Legionella pneumophila]